MTKARPQFSKHSNHLLAKKANCRLVRFDSETYLECDLKVRHLVIDNVARCLDDLEPGNMSDCFGAGFNFAHTTHLSTIFFDVNTLICNFLAKLKIQYFRTLYDM